MRIEKINDKQIRCTLSSEDLSSRNMNLSELAYGSDKARALFREMLTKASNDFGFQAEDIPLMVEAVPLSEGSIMLLITKVDDPEEMDTRFARFAPGSPDELSAADPAAFLDPAPQPEGADDIIEQFHRLCEELTADLPEEQTENAEADASAMPVHEPDFYQVFSFSSLNEVCRASKVLCRLYDDYNTLYKDPDSRRYYLLLHKGSHTPETFNKICNILSEFGEHQKVNPATEAFYEEHYEAIVYGRAIQALWNL